VWFSGDPDDCALLYAAGHIRHRHLFNTAGICRSALAAIIGFIAFGSLLGNFVITRIFPGYKKSLIKETLVGLSLLWLLGWIPFYIGMAIKVFAITFGLGGVLLALSRRKARP